MYAIESRWPKHARWRRVTARPHGETHSFDEKGRLVFFTIESVLKAKASMERANAGDFRVVKI